MALSKEQCRNDFKTDSEEKNNWMQAHILVKLTRDGLIGYVEITLEQIRLEILSSVGVRGQICCNANSSFCNNSMAIEQKLLDNHRFKKMLKFTNEKYCRDVWAIARFYLRKTDGALKTKDDFDLNAVLNVILNCGFFTNKFSDMNKTMDNTFTQLRTECNKLRHKYSMRVSTQDLEKLRKLVRAALTDPCGLNRDSDAQIVMKKFMQMTLTYQTNVSQDLRSGICRNYNMPRSIVLNQSVDENYKTSLQLMMTKMPASEIVDRLIKALDTNQSLVNELHQTLPCQHGNDSTEIFKGNQLPLRENQFPAPKWCNCGKCREMPTELEQHCCRQHPGICTPDVFKLIDMGVLAFFKKRRPVRPCQEMWQLELRRSVYRAYSHQLHGRLGRGQRIPLPSCFVWKVRDRFPSPSNKYTGFVLTAGAK